MLPLLKNPDAGHAVTTALTLEVDTPVTKEILRCADKKSFASECHTVELQRQRAEVFVESASDDEALADLRRRVRLNHYALEANLVPLPEGLLHGQMAVDIRMNRIAQRAEARAIRIHGKVNIEDQTKIRIGDNAALVNDVAAEMMNAGLSGFGQGRASEQDGTGSFEKSPPILCRLCG